MRAAIYTRISKHNDRVPKVADQEALCRGLAEQHGYEVVKVYEDDGISASKGLNRPGWNQMLTDVAEGKFDVLMAQSDDRFTRQPMEKETLLLASISGGIRWHTFNEGQIDPSTADGMMRSGLSTLLSRTETMRKSERQRQANAALRAKGIPLKGGVRPFGYAADKIAAHPVEGPLVQQAYTDFIGGTTMSAIRTRWNRAEVRTTNGNAWDIAKVEKVLRRGRNAGYVMYDKVLLKDEHGEFLRGLPVALVETDTFHAALALLNDPKRKLTKAYEPKWLMTSLARCGACGNLMKTSTRNSEKVYRCGVHDGVGIKKAGVRHVSIRCSVLDPLVRKAVASAILMAPVDSLDDPDTESLNALHVRLGALREADARLIDAVQEGILELAEVKARRITLKADTVDIEAQMADIAQRNAKAAMMVDARHALWSGGKVSIPEAAGVRAQIGERFDGLELQQKRALVKSLLDITIMPGREDARIRIKHLVATSLNKDAPLA